MKKMWAFLFIVFCSINIVLNVHASEMEQATVDISEYLIQEGGRPKSVSTDVEVLLQSVPENSVALFSVRRSAGALTLEEYLVQEFKQRTAEIDISAYNIPISDVGTMYYTIVNRHPELFYITGSMSYSYFYNETVSCVRPQYADYTQEEIDAVYAAMDRPLRMLSDDMTVVEKILFLHDYLCINVEYSEDDLVSHRYHCIEGVAIEGKAVCEGYAEAFQYFMNELDIPCNIVTNDNHAWNQVKIDGEWYMLDATHDDPVSDLYGRACHTYFLKSADLMSNRTWVEEDFEICDSTRFDNAFWTKTDTQTIYHEGSWYYLNAEEKNLYCHEYGVDSIEDPGEIVMDLDYTWNVIGSNSFWVGCYSKLAKVADQLVYSTPSKIYVCDFDGNNLKCLVDVDTSKGYIYGMRQEEGKITYQISEAPYGSPMLNVAFDYIDISSAQIQLFESEFYYTGEKQYPGMKVLFDGTELKENRHFEVEYNYPVSGVGEVSILITGTGYYKGTASATYIIKKGAQQIVCPQVFFEKGYGCDAFPLNATVEGGVLEYQTSNPEVVVVDTKGNVEIKGMGTAVITITAPSSEYYEEDTETVDIVVNRTQLPNTFTLSEDVYTYNGMEIKPTVEAGSLSFEDYSITYVNNVNTGNKDDENSPMVIVAGNGKYIGEIRIPFTIQPRELGDICNLPPISELRYGQSLQDSLSAGNTGTVYVNETETIEGVYTFVDPTLVPNAGTESYKVIFTPLDAGNNMSKEFLVEVTIKPYGTAPNAPASNVKVEYGVEKLSEIKLPSGWKWKKEDALTEGKTVQYIAIYVGSDKGNYEVTEATVAITRLSCSHTHISDAIQKEAGCTEDGKKVTVCNDCRKVILEERLPMHGHSWDKGEITKEATAIVAGEKTYTCAECETTKIEAIPAKGIPKKNATLKNEGGTANYVVTKAGKTGGTVTYNKNLKTSEKQVKIPSKVTIDGITYKVTAIANGAFKNNKMIKVTIPSTVTTIGNEAFSGCKKLTSVTIPSNVKKIGKKAFYKCSKLKSISIKTQKLTKNSIGSNAFKGIYKKAVVKVPRRKSSTYEKWIKKAGAGSKITIRKQ